MIDPKNERFLDVKEVSARYGGKIAVRTLENWRTRGGGPPFVKIGGRVLYKLSALLDWENSRAAWNTSERAPG